MSGSNNRCPAPWEVHGQRLFLEGILKEASQFKYQELLEHASADQINAVKEMVLNVLKNRIPIKPHRFLNSNVAIRCCKKSESAEML